MKKLTYALIFLLGFFSCAFIFYSALYFKVEKPLGFTGFTVISEETPGDWITNKDIVILNDRIIIYINGATLSSYADTGSMIPLLDKNSNGIRIKPENENQINTGDIVSYRKGNDLIVHRVIKKAEDEQGVYFITKGDGNQLADEKIRFSDIKYVTIGILY